MSEEMKKDTKNELKKDTPNDKKVLTLEELDNVTGGREPEVTHIVKPVMPVIPTNNKKAY